MINFSAIVLVALAHIAAGAVANFSTVTLAPNDPTVLRIKVNESIKLTTAVTNKTSSSFYIFEIHTRDRELKLADDEVSEVRGLRGRVKAGSNSQAANQTSSRSNSRTLPEVLTLASLCFPPPRATSPSRPTPSSSIPYKSNSFIRSMSPSSLWSGSTQKALRSLGYA